MDNNVVELRSGSFASFGWALPGPDIHKHGPRHVNSRNGLEEPGSEFVTDTPTLSSQEISLDQVYLALEQLYMDIEPNGPEDK